MPLYSLQGVRGPALEAIQLDRDAVPSWIGTATFMLSPAWCRRVAAWICGWAYVAGNITITLAVNFGTTLFFVACINVFESEPGVGVFQTEKYQVFLIFLAITLLTNTISSLGNREQEKKPRKPWTLWNLPPRPIPASTRCALAEATT